jgi:hypothetical protein
MLKLINFLFLVAVLFPRVCRSQSPEHASQVAHPSHADYEAAIETIATSRESKAVQEAAALLRSGGMDSIAVLITHLSDEREGSSYLRGEVIGRVTMGAECFELIQHQLESHTSKLDADYSPLNQATIKEWLEERNGMSLEQLRREACIGSFQVILDLEKKNPDYDYTKVLRAYAIRLVHLDAALHKKDKKPSTQGKRQAHQPTSTD